MKVDSNLVKKSMYFEPTDMAQIPSVLEKRETESEFVRTAIKNEIDRRKAHKKTENPSK